ncbi:hypothetical protein [Microcoleus sp. B4-D4]
MGHGASGIGQTGHWANRAYLTTVDNRYMHVARSSSRANGRSYKLLSPLT